MVLKYILILILLGPLGCIAQSASSIWCFGDSAGIDFGTNPPQTFISQTKSRGSCVSVADSAGDLLFYSYTRAGVFGKSSLVFNKTHQLMENGDTIVGQGWYQELVVINDPGNINRYYLFSVGVTNAALQQGFYYSIIDMSYNGGLGKVVSRNNQLLSDFMTDGCTAIKHGNGRDWWVIARKSNGLTTGIPTDEYYIYLISPSGVTGPYIRHSGFLTNYALSKIIASPSGEKLVYLNPRGLFDFFSFDRCTGDLSLIQTVFPENTLYLNFFSGDFSPDESKFYIQTLASPDTNYLIQFDLDATNIAASADTLDMQTYQTYISGYIKLAPDNKVYVAKQYSDGVSVIFPYPDTTYNNYNTYLGVINDPDSYGAACNYQPYSFYLGGARTYLGLPNNPYFELQGLQGSPCDSLTSVQEYSEILEPVLNVYYDHSWQTLFVNCHHLSGSHYHLSVTNSIGQKFVQNNGDCDPFITQSLSSSAFSPGAYFVTVETEKEKLVKPFIVY